MSMSVQHIDVGATLFWRQLPAGLHLMENIFLKANVYAIRENKSTTFQYCLRP